MKLVPAEVDHGVKFIRSDQNTDNIIEAIWSNVSETVLSTTISNKTTLKISTIEHLMSALSGLHIDNLLVYINDSEVPTDIQVMINNNEKGASLLRIIEVIGQDKLERIDEDTIYFIVRTLNELNIDQIRNEILLKVLPLKV